MKAQKLEIEISKIFVNNTEMARNLKGFRLKEGEIIFVDFTTREGMIVPSNPQLN